MTILVSVMYESFDGLVRKNLLNTLLEKKLVSLAELYGIRLPHQQVWIWRRYNNVEYLCNINDELEFTLRLKIPNDSSLVDLCLTDASLVDYVAFCIMMASWPDEKTKPNSELITSYVLKHGYEFPPRECQRE